MEKTIEINPKNSTSIYILGTCYYKTGENDKAIEYLNKSLIISEFSIKCWQTLGEIYLKKEMFQESADSYEKYGESCDYDEKTLINLIKIYSSLNNHEKLIDTYTKIINLDVKNKKNIKYMQLLGEEYFILGKYKEVIIQYRKIIEIDKNNLEALIFLGVAYGCNKQYKYSVIAYRRAMVISSENPSLWYSLGKSYENLAKNNKNKEEYINKCYKESIKCYKKAIKLDPSNLEYLFEIGKVYIEIENKAASINTINKISISHPSIYSTDLILLFNLKWPDSTYRDNLDPL